ncbi:MAG: DsbA family protein [Sulfurimonas sp.]|nr:DsbA family protein [Sulfurimonas sp.]MDD3835420.1 DsbA family protein [Sulfurimonas sp.]
MLRLLLSTLIVSSFLQANTDADMEAFLQKTFSANPNILKLDVKVHKKIKLEQVDGWSAFILNVDANVKDKEGSRDVNQKMIWFSNGTTISPDLIDMKTGTSLKDTVSPSFEDSHYKKQNLIYGNADATHKVAIFSDPLCPFCRDFVPKAIEQMKKDPKKFALYYYHLPLESLHPAAVTLVKAATAAELKGEKDVVLKLYKVEVDARESDESKILAAFNKSAKTNITLQDIKSKAVQEHFSSDIKIASDLMVNGTPTMFFDGKLDKTKVQYQKVK